MISLAHLMAVNGLFVMEGLRDGAEGAGELYPTVSKRFGMGAVDFGTWLADNVILPLSAVEAAAMTFEVDFPGVFQYDVTAIIGYDICAACLGNKVDAPAVLTPLSAGTELLTSLYCVTTAAAWFAVNTVTDDLAERAALQEKLINKASEMIREVQNAVSA